MTKQDNRCMNYMFLKTFLNIVENGKFEHVNFNSQEIKNETKEKQFQKASFDTNDLILTVQSEGETETFKLPKDFAIEFIEKDNVIGIRTETELFVLKAIESK